MPWTAASADEPLEGMDAVEAVLWAESLAGTRYLGKPNSRGGFKGAAKQPLWNLWLGNVSSSVSLSQCSWDGRDGGTCSSNASANARCSHEGRHCGIARVLVRDLNHRRPLPGDSKMTSRPIRRSPNASHEDRHWVYGRAGRRVVRSIAADGRRSEDEGVRR